MSCLRSCIEPTSRSSDRPGWPISRENRPTGMTPVTRAPSARAAFGKLAHQANAAASVDEADASLRQQRAEGAGRVPVAGIGRC